VNEEKEKEKEDEKVEEEKDLKPSGPQPVKTDDNKFPVHQLLEQYSELKYENQLIPWSTTNTEYLKELKEQHDLPYVKSVVKLQERINEFVHTEKSHLKKLRTLASVYYPILRENVDGGEDAFNEKVPSVTKLISLHTALIELLKERVATSPIEIPQIGDVVQQWTSDSNFFSIFKENSIDFCVKQKIASDYINAEVARQPTLQIEMKNREHSSLCNRLSCSDFLACQFQRLTKYPLLIDSILKATDPGTNPEEVACLKNVLSVFKDLLMQVNQRIKSYQDKEQLEKVSNQLDTTSLLKFPAMKEYAGIDFTDKILLHYGPAKFLISGDDNKELRSAHCFLFEDLFLITQKSKKVFETKVIETKVKAEAYIYYPIIKVDPYRMKVQKNNALALNFYMIVSGEVSMIFDFQAITRDQRNDWVERITMQLEINKPDCTPVPPKMKSLAGGSSQFSLFNSSQQHSGKHTAGSSGLTHSESDSSLAADFDGLSVSEFTEKISSLPKDVLLEILQKTMGARLNESEDKQKWMKIIGQLYHQENT